jgi:hypothetical protein
MRAAGTTALPRLVVFYTGISLLRAAAREKKADA